jgi:predicted lipoprotein with Yx(FWY)xxD motif
MSASVGIRMPRAVRLGAGLAAAPGGTLPTAACSNSGSSSSSAAASSAGGTPSPAAVAVGSGLVITTKSGSAGAFLIDGSGRAVYLWAKDGKGSSACSGATAPAETVTSAAGGGGF